MFQSSKRGRGNLISALKFNSSTRKARRHCSYFANARIALSNFVHTLVFAVFGNGSEMASRTRRKIIEQLDLPEQQVFTLDFPELEGYLLDHAAVVRAFPAITLPPAELAARLDPALHPAGSKEGAERFAGGISSRGI